MTNCKNCTTNCVYRGKDNEARCGSFVGTVTNADRIRAMSDEELKDFLCSIMKCEFCKFDGWDGCELLEWLKQPAD